MDLRAIPIFTIDSAETKDIDDAISLQKLENGGYELGVHIADVSHYVRPGSALDNEAYERATSIYYADKVIPMLPTQLSNGICSLNPQEDRFAFSCLMRLDEQGNILGYNFVKSVIRSRVKGVYKEINALLESMAAETTEPVEADEAAEPIDCGDAERPEREVRRGTGAAAHHGRAVPQAPGAAQAARRHGY